MARNNDRSRGSKRAPAAASLRPRRGKPKVCIFCRDSIPWVDYKDANLLGRFLSERAKIKARRTTGNCNRHQREVAVAIKTARELALLPYAKRTVAERLGGRGGGRGGRGGPGGPGRPARRPREDRDRGSTEAAGRCRRRPSPRPLTPPPRASTTSRSSPPTSAATTTRNRSLAPWLTAPGRSGGCPPRPGHGQASRRLDPPVPRRGDPGRGRRLHRAAPGRRGRGRAGRRRDRRPRPAARQPTPSGHRHRRLGRRPLRPAPLHGPRAGPGRPRPVPRRPLRHRPADRRRLLLRLRAARRTDGNPAHFTEDDLERIDARMREIIGEAQPFVREEHGQGGRAGAVRRPALQAGDHRGRREHRGRRGRRRLRVPQPPPATARAGRRSSTCAAAPTSPHQAAGRLQAHEGGRRLLAGRREAPDAPADLRHRLGHQEGPRRAPPPAGGGRAARPPQARRRARPDLVPRRARRRAGRLAPEGRHGPQADGGLLPGRARGRPATSSSSRPT